MSEAMLRIAALNVDYGRCIDDDRLEDWPGFFTQHAHYRITTADNHARGWPAGVIHATSRAMLQDRVSATRQASVYESQRYRHVIGLPAVTELASVDPALRAWRAETGFMVARIMRDGRTELFATGRYLDRIEQHDERLAFAERIVVCDSPVIDTLLVLPL